MYKETQTKRATKRIRDTERKMFRKKSSDSKAK